jgi:hypothetical protein
MMQQTLPEPFHYARHEATTVPGRGVRVLRRAGRVLDQFDRLIGYCLRAVGRAYLDGFIAYGAAMHGFAHPIEKNPPATPPADAPIWSDLSETWLKHSPRQH